MVISDVRPLAVFFEHPDWHRPLFAELERRGIPFVALDATTHAYDPGDDEVAYSLVLNRMSPSAALRGHGTTVFHTTSWLAHLERIGARVVNGAQAWRLETSKADQLSLLGGLGLPFPRTRVIHDPRHALAAALDLRFPVVVKPNIGGSGAGIRRFDTPAELASAAEGLDLGLDRTALVQEFVPAEGGFIVRVEVLDGRFLYGLRVFSDGGFNLCPADICLDADGGQLQRGACPADAPVNGVRVEGYRPPHWLIHAVERIAARAGIEVGGVEYLVDARDGGVRFYDVNALSNFVADAERVVGFDPFVRLVDWLELEAGLIPAGQASVT